MAPFGHVLIEESAAKAVAGIGTEQVDRAPSGHLDQTIYSVEPSEVGLQHFYLDAILPEIGQCRPEGPVGCDKKVVAVLRGQASKFETDT